MSRILSREEIIHDCAVPGCEEPMATPVSCGDLRRLIESHELLRSELETERLRLAACGIAALGYFKDCQPEYRSASLQVTLRLWGNYSALRSENERLRRALQFYADIKGYRHALIPVEATPIEWDMGEKARQALRPTHGEKE